MHGQGIAQGDSPSASFAIVAYAASFHSHDGARRVAAEDSGGLVWSRNFGAADAFHDGHFYAADSLAEVDGRGRGAVGVFRIDQDRVRRVRVLMPPMEVGVGSRFGSSVDVDDRGIVVGAHESDYGGTVPGVAWVY